MNTPTGLRWLLFATIPYHRYFDVTALIARGNVLLGRRIGRAIQATHQRVAKRRQRAPHASYPQRSGKPAATSAHRP